MKLVLKCQHEKLMEKSLWELHWKQKHRYLANQPNITWHLRAYFYFTLHMKVKRLYIFRGYFSEKNQQFNQTRLPPCGAVKTWSCNFCQKTYGKWHVNVHQQRTIYGVCHKWSFLQHCRRRNYNAPAANNNLTIMEFYATFLQKQCW